MEKIYWQKRLFQFIIEKATNYTYVGLSNHKNVFGVDIKILIREISVKGEVVRKSHYLYLIISGFVSKHHPLSIDENTLK